MLARNARRALSSKPLRVDGREVTVSVSIGASLYPGSRA